MPTCRATASAVRRVVAGDHDDLEPEVPERADRGGRVLLDRVGDRDDAGGRPSTATYIAVLPSAASRAAVSSSVDGVDARVGEQLACGRPAPRARRRSPARPWPVTESNALALGERDPPRLGARDDRRGERMLRGALGRRHQPEQLLLVEAVGDDDVGQGRLALR